MQKSILQPDTPIRKAILLKATIKDLQDEITVGERGAIETFRETHAEKYKALQASQTQFAAALDECINTKQMEDGFYHVVNKARATRVVNNEKFRQAFPEIFLQIANIPVTKAEVLVGKAQLAPLCDTSFGEPVWDVEPIKPFKKG
jgi:hypothetical protein